MSRDWLALLIIFGICFAVGASGSVFTASSMKGGIPVCSNPAELRRRGSSVRSGQFFIC